MEEITVKPSQPIILAGVIVIVALASAYTATISNESAAAERRSSFDNRTRSERLTPDGTFDDESRASAARDNAD